MLKPRLMRTVRLRDRDRRQCSDSSPCYACRGGCGAAVDIFVKELERLERTRAGAAHLQGKGISSRPRMSVQILVNGIVAEVISRRILSVARTYQSYVPRGHQLRLITCSLRASSLHECRMD